MLTRERTRQLVVVLAWSAAYALAIWVGRSTRLDGTQLALVWPAAGVSFLWLQHRWPHRRQWAVDLTALASVTVVGNLLTGSALALALTFGAVNVVQAVVAVGVMRRFVPSLRLESASAFRALAVAALAGSAASASIAVPVVVSGSGADLATTAAAWLLRNGVSTVLVGAVGLRLLTRRGATTPPLRAEHLAMLAALGAVLWFAFFSTQQVPLAFLTLPVSLWIAARAETTYVTVHVLLAGVAVVVATLSGLGPFTTGSDLTDAVLAQGFVLVLAAVSFVVALDRDERARLHVRLTASQAEAEVTAHELGAVLRASSNGVMVLDRDGGTVLMNPAATELLGTPPDGSRLAWDDYYTVLDAAGTTLPQREWPASRALAGEHVDGVDMVVRTRGTEQERVLAVSAAPLPPADLDGPSGGAVVMLHDVTAERRAQQEVRRHRDLLEAVLEAATDQSIIGTDPDGTITVFNEGAERMLGYGVEEMLGSTPAAFHDLAEVVAVGAEIGVEPGFEVFVHRARTEHRTETRRWTYVRKDGVRLQVMLSVSAMREPDGTVSGYIGVATDVTRQLAAERDLAESEARFRRAFENAPVGMMMVGRTATQTGRVLRVNAAMTQLTGRSREELLASCVDDLVVQDDASPCTGSMSDVLAGAVDEARCEVRFGRPDGAECWGLMSSSLIPATAEHDAYAVCLVQDVTSRRLAEQALEHQALHDALTGLPNRTLFRDRLQHALAGAERSRVPAGVLFIDLDGFKQVNDGAGHGAGDDVLRQVSALLETCVRPGDTVARLGGDEFAVLCPVSPTLSVLETVAERIRTAVQDREFAVHGHRFRLGASIGVSMSVGRRTCDQLMQDADAAMYLAKRSGRNAVRVHDVKAEAFAARTARLVPQLRAAIENGELVMHGQPVVDLATGRAVAVETLIRWRHPDRGLLPPSEFLDVLETSDLILPAGRFVLDESCRMAAAWTEVLGPCAPSVHVNVSGRQLEDGNLTRDVLASLARHSLPGHRLVIELTETHVPMIANSLRRDLERLRERGVRIAIDDIGTGYSSLARLTELPVDMLKIDRGFVAGLGSDAGCDAIVRAVAGIGASLGMVVVAEGVETPAQADLLAGHGVDTAQGYLWSPPRPEQELVADLAAPIRRARALPDAAGS